MKKNDIFELEITDMGTDGDCGGRYLFYDENGNLIESGNMITDTLTYAESENFIMEAYSVWNDSVSYKVSNAFNTNYDIYDCCFVFKFKCFYQFFL